MDIGTARGYCCEKLVYAIILANFMDYHTKDYMMNKSRYKDAKKPFKWKHFTAEIILWLVRWYCRYALSYNDLKEMVLERGMKVERSTICRWVHEYGAELAKRVKSYLKQTSDSWRLDETYLKIKGKWHYFYRAIDKTGQTLDWMLSRHRNTKAAKRFFKKILGNSGFVAKNFIRKSFIFSALIVLN